MVRVNFRPSDFRRQVANEGALVQKNRYFEQNPFLSDDGAALLARPGLRYLTNIGDGPIRGLASEAGSFNGDLFTVSGAQFWRMDNLLNKTLSGDNLFNPSKGFVRMAITAQIGDIPEYCFVADGRNLFVYTDTGFAHNALTGTPANNDVVRIDTMYYKYTNASVDAGTPLGTLANPWLVGLLPTPIESFYCLVAAVNANGSPGVNYSTAVTPNLNVTGLEWTSTIASFRAKLPGLAGNAIISTETGAAISWTGGGTFTGGGAPTFTTVLMPDNVGAIDVAVIQSYVIVIPVQQNGYQGRFYWIQPGEVVIDPLDFATAERSPDQVFGVQVFEDQFWLPGESTTEVWYVAGPNPNDPTSPVMQRLQGVVLDRGSWENTPKAVHETMMIVDADGGVFRVNGGSPKRVSTPDIEEEIRQAMARQSNFI